MIHVDISHESTITQYNIYGVGLLYAISPVLDFGTFSWRPYERFEVPDAALAIKGLARIWSRSAVQTRS